MSTRKNKSVEKKKVAKKIIVRKIAPIAEDKHLVELEVEGAPIPLTPDIPLPSLEKPLEFSPEEDDSSPLAKWFKNLW